MYEACEVSLFRYTPTMRGYPLVFLLRKKRVRFDSDRRAFRFLPFMNVVLSALLLQNFSTGVALGFSSVLCPALLSPNTTDISATSDQALWLSASLGISSAIGTCILSYIMGIYGRRTVHLVINILQFIGWINFYFANSIIVLFIGRFFQGVGIAVLQINGVIVCEYASPFLREYYISLKTMCMALGVLFCHSSMLICTWRQVALTSLVCSMLAILITLIWPESPAYLAMKGRYSKCEQSFKWLHGSSNESDKELNELLSAQMEQSNKRRISQKKYLRNLWKIFLKKDFQKPLFIATLLTICIDTCGRYYLFTYVIEIINNLVSDTSMAVYYSIAGDCLTIFALLLAGPVNKYLKRRTILFGFGSVSVILIFTISLSTYVKMNFATFYVIWLTPCLILAQLFIINLSLVPVCLTIMGEIFTLDDRSLGSLVSGLIFSLFYTLNIKFTAILMRNIGVDGTYALYGLCLFLCLLILYYILPETKNRTLQNIEDEIKGLKRVTPETQTILH